MQAIYSEVSTRKSHADFIQKFWILDNSLHPFCSLPQNALPNGCCTLAFISGNGVSLRFSDHCVELAEGIYLSGQITTKVSVSMKPYSKAIMTQLKPWLPSMITNVPIDYFTNNAVSLELVNDKLYQTMATINLADEAVVSGTFYQALDGYLQSTTDTYFIQWAFNRLQRGLINQETIADMVRLSGYSQRRIEQNFKRLIGPTAKQMQHILQLRQVISDLQRSDQPQNLSALAYRHGYYDQSHFIKAYQRVLDELPTAFNRDNYLLPIAAHFDFLQS